MPRAAEPPGQATAGRSPRSPGWVPEAAPRGLRHCLRTAALRGPEPRSRAAAAGNIFLMQISHRRAGTIFPGQQKTHLAQPRGFTGVQQHYCYPWHHVVPRLHQESCSRGAAHPLGDKQQRATACSSPSRRRKPLGDRELKKDQTLTSRLGELSTPAARGHGCSVLVLPQEAFVTAPGVPCT